MNLATELRILTSLLTFTGYPPEIHSLSTLTDYYVRFLLHMLILTAIFALNFYIIEAKRHFDYLIIFMFFFAITRIIMDFALNFIYLGYFEVEIEDTYLVAVMSLCTMYYFHLVMLVFMVVRIGPWMWGFVYGCLGNFAFRHCDALITMTVDIGEDGSIHIGNVAGTVYFLIGMLWLLLLQDLMKKMDDGKKRKIYRRM